MKRKEWQPTLHLSTLSSSVYTKYTVYAFSKNKYVPLTNEAKFMWALMCSMCFAIVLTSSSSPSRHSLIYGTSRQQCLTCRSKFFINSKQQPLDPLFIEKGASCLDAAKATSNAQKAKMRLSRLVDQRGNRRPYTAHYHTTVIDVPDL